MNKWKCKFCNSCVVINKPSSKSIHLRHCKNFQDFKENVWTVDFLYSEYVDKGKSAKEISNDAGLVSATPVIKLLKKYNIRQRNISESKKQKRCVEKTKKTCLEKYGCEHSLSKNSPIRKKMIENMIKEYGVKNVFQLNYVKDKTKKTCLEKYGCEYPMQNDIVKSRVWNTTYKRHGIKYGILKAHDINKSRPQKIIEQLLISKDYIFESEYKIYPHFVDICFVDKKKIVEVYGDFWHANPRKYCENDILNFPNNKKMLASDKWKYDKKRLDSIMLQGFKVLVIWEYDIYNNIEGVKEMLWKYLK